MISTLVEVSQAVLAQRAIRTKARKTNPLKKRLARDYRGVWLDQEREFDKGFRRLRPLFPREDLMSESVWVAEVVQPNNINPILDAAFDLTRDFSIEAIDDAVAAALQAGGDSLMDTVGVGLGISFDIDVNEGALAYLNAFGATQVTNIDESTRRGVVRIILRAANEGWSWQTTANELGNMWAGFRSSVGRPSWFNNRGELIAVTEIGNAYEEGSLLATQQLIDSGLEMEKRWSGPDDDRTSQPCKDNLAAGWISFDTEFPSGHQRPLEHPGCRHTNLYRRRRL